MNQTCIFTIVSKNYLHYARTLMESVAKHVDNARLIVVICDRDGYQCIETDSFDTINISELHIPKFEEFVFRYNILELNTAVKPFAFSHFLSQGHQQVIYFDPDICIYHDLSPMIDLISDHNIVLTPHLTSTIDDTKRPSELDILRAGSNNLGYIGVSNSAETKRFVNWWKVRLRKLCINDVSRALFVDQKWVDLVPGMFDKVFINRDPSWNVAYWNLNHRKLMSEPGKSSTVDGKALVFFHFSGFRHKEGVLSIHQNRFTLSDCSSTIKKLFDDYGKRLTENDSDDTSNSTYAFNHFRDGSVIAEPLRAAYREHTSTLEEFPDISLDSPDGYLTELLNHPAEINGQSSPFVSRLGYYIYQSRPDLKAAFPSLGGLGAQEYAGWFVSSLTREYGLSSAFTDQILNTLHNLQVEQAKPISYGKKLFLRFHSSKHLRALSQKIVPSQLRKSVKAHLLRSTNAVIGDIAVVADHQPHSSTITDREAPAALNLFGYLFAESGTGEAARSTIRACNAADIQLHCVDIRLNNISRMSESPSAEMSGEPSNSINLFHINADQTQEVINSLENSYTQGKYNIGFWFWELEKLPAQYNEAYKYLDEIWVASSFCQKAVALEANIPTTLIPLNIDLDQPSKTDRAELGLDQDSFLIFSSMDMLSIPERKNPLAVLEAFDQFQQETHQPVKLLLKLSNLSNACESLQAAIKSYVERLPVQLIDDYLDREDLTNLMSACDCYMALHRAEGFGLPIAEAMFLEKPVVATGWSSNMDFMTINNSYPVKFELVELDQDYGPYEEGNVWASPDINHAKECLLDILSNPEEARARAQRAARDIREHYSPASVGELIKSRLNRINQRGVKNRR